MTKLSDKSSGMIMGLLFWVSMVPSLIYANFFEKIFLYPLEEVHLYKTEIAFGAILELTNCFAVIGLAVVPFHINKLYSLHLSLLYLSFRIIESTILLVGIVSGLLMIPLSEKYVSCYGNNNNNNEESIFTMMTSLQDLIWESKCVTLRFGILVCAFGSLFFTYSLLRSKVVNRIMASWGFIGYVLTLLGAVADIFGFVDSLHGNGLLFYAIGGLFELIGFPLYLMIVGFNSQHLKKRK